MHELSLLINFLQTHEKAIGLLFTVGGLAVSVSLQALLHKLAVKKPVVAHLMAHLASIAATAVALISSNGNVPALPVYATVFIGSQFWHIIAVNPFYYKYALPFLKWLAAQKTPVEPAAAVAETPSFS